MDVTFTPSVTSTPYKTGERLKKKKEPLSVITEGNKESRTPRKRSKAPLPRVAFGSKVPQRPSDPRVSVIRVPGNDVSWKNLRVYPAPSLRTPQRQLTVPFTPLVSKKHPKSISPEPCEPPRMAEITEKRHPLQQIECPDWVTRLSKPKRCVAKATLANTNYNKRTSNPTEKGHNGWLHSTEIKNEN